MVVFAVISIFALVVVTVGVVVVWGGDRARAQEVKQRGNPNTSLQEDSDTVASDPKDSNIHS